jgi:PIN domain nuclease of toxin-antitoxin system
MRVLLDTHAFLWFITDDRRLSSRPREIMEDPENDLLLSIASLWEIAIKTSLGKLTLARPFDELMPHELAGNAIEILPIRLDHLTTLTSLPFHHRDPFDRLIVAQAVVEEMPVLSGDSAFSSYPARLLW